MNRHPSPLTPSQHLELRYFLVTFTGNILSLLRYRALAALAELRHLWIWPLPIEYVSLRPPLLVSGYVRPCGRLRAKREWTAQRGRRKRGEDSEVQETEWVDGGGQGHSCDKEVGMKDVASV